MYILNTVCGQINVVYMIVSYCGCSLMNVEIRLMITVTILFFSEEHMKSTEYRKPQLTVDTDYLIIDQLHMQLINDRGMQLYQYCSLIRQGRNRY